jgi:type I restriction enzyme, S subunit
MPLFEKAGAQAKRTGPSLADEMVSQGFGVSRFVDNFDALVDALGSSSALRRLILDLAVRGRLTLPAEAATAGGGPFPIPEHWAWGRGEDVFTFVTSGSRGWASYYSDTGPLFLRIGNLDYETTDLDLRSLQHVQPPKNAEGVRTRVEAGDILISITGDTGMVGLVPPNLGEAYINQHIALARPGAKLLPAFIARVLTAPSLLGRLQSAQRGIKNSLGLDDVRRLAVPVPPLAEQKRIVARVDQLMALIDDLEAKQTRKREVSSRFTKASLEALTTAAGPEEFEAAWKRVVENFPTVIDNAEKVGLVRGALIDLAVSGALTGARPGAWASQSLAQVATETRYGTSKKCDRDTSLTPVLRIPNVVGGALDLSDLKYAAFNDAELEDLSLAEGDLLVVRSNGSKDLVGRASVVDARASGFAYAGYLVRIRVNREMVEPAWIQLALRGTRLRTQIESPIRTTTGVHNINTTEILGLSLPIPSLEEQRGALARIRSLMRLCDDLEAKLRRAEDRASKLVEAVVQEMVA